MLDPQYQLTYHRGRHSEQLGVPENSLPAFQRAVDLGRGFELDVHLTADGQLVVLHDSDTLRMTGVAGRVEDMSLEAVRFLRLQGTECRIPTLEEVLELNNGQVPMILEIKNFRKENLGVLETRLLGLLAQYPGALMLESFNPAVLAWLRRHEAPYLCGQLASKQGKWAEDFYYRHLLFNPLTQPDFIAYDIDEIDYRLRGACRKRQIPLIGWTIRRPEQLEKARRLCDGVIYEKIEIETL